MNRDSDVPIVIPIGQWRPDFTRAQPGWLFVLMSLAVLGVCAAGSGILVQWARSADEGSAFWWLTTPFPASLAWLQWQGTFRKHERRANAAGNWLIGIAALLANGLAALPFITAIPLTLPVLGAFVGLIFVSSAGGVLNLAWARELRRAGWNEEEYRLGQRWWSFSLTDLLLVMMLVAIFTSSMVHFQANRGRLEPVEKVSPFVPDRTVSEGPLEP